MSETEKEKDGDMEGNATPNAFLPTAIEPPDSLPSDGEIGPLELREPKPLVLVLGSHTLAFREKEVAEREARVRAALATLDGQKKLADEINAGFRDQEPDIETPDPNADSAGEQRDATPEGMALYWQVVPEVTHPTNKCTFGSWAEAADALKKAFPILNASSYVDSLRPLALALMGEVRHVPVDQFSDTVAMIRALQAHEPQDIAIVQATDGGERALSATEIREQEDRNADEALIAMFRDNEATQALGQDGGLGLNDPIAPQMETRDEPGERVEWDVGEALGREPRPDSAPAPIRRGRRTVEHRPLPPAMTSPQTSTETAAKKTSPRLVYAIILLILVAVFFSIAYLFSNQVTTTKLQSERDNTQDEWDVEQQITLDSHDEQIARVVTGLMEKEKTVISLTDERNSLRVIAESSATTIRLNTLVMDKVLQDNINTKTELGRVSARMIALEGELERLRQKASVEESK
jgi:hypothetical protein